MDGVTEGIHLILKCLISHPKDGIFIPVPVYPLYPAVITSYGGSEIHYMLEEERGWQISYEEL